jgi:hypothetical protein
MSYILAERDGILYAKETFISEDAPVEITNWYQLATPYAQFVSWFCSEDVARQFIGGVLYPTVNPPLVFENTQQWRFHRANAGKPEHTETTPIPELAHRGRNPLVWHRGTWHKETHKGLVKLDAQEAIR